MKKLSKLLTKGFERSVYWNEYKTKSSNKNTTTKIFSKYFFEGNFVGVDRLFILVYGDKGGNTKRFNAWKYYLPRGIIHNYDFVINGKNLYDQAIDSYKMIWKN